MAAGTWNIKPRAGVCATCGATFEPGAQGHSILEPGSDEGFARRDLCPACFAALDPAALKALSGVWSWRVPKRPPRAKAEAEAVPKETAGHLLRVLLAGNAPEDRAVIYVLAILLERGKQLVERSVTQNAQGEKVRLYEERASGDLLPIIDPALAPEDLPAVQARILELLGGEGAQ
ncbi:MAG: hypothetical protein ACI4RT_08040 [Candidatus Spyradenecus sp.]